LDRAENENEDAFPGHTNDPDDKLKPFMLFVRRRLSWLICAWLTCQIAGIAAAPITFCCKDVPTVADEEDCCPGLLPGQLCPMHHKTAAGSKSDCKMRNICAPADAMLVALAGGIGVLPRTTAVVSAFDPGDAVVALAPTALARSARPESPPPRS
jgi:hypothetical protein